jgi:hypothetical protein
MPPESNAEACSNGSMMEDIIRALYPGAQFEYKGLIDLHINGRPVEIKSCKITVTDNSHNNKIRSGRFVFSDLQHQTLLENEGEYIFLVHNECVPILYLRVPAHFINIPLFSGIKSISWKSVISGAIA